MLAIAATLGLKLICCAIDEVPVAGAQHGLQFFASDLC
jgi:hypothetical protein